MTTSRFGTTFILAICALGAIGLSRESLAQTSDAETAAQILFDEAMSLMDGGNYAAACPKLVESHALDRGAGTLFRLGECYVQTGKLASAYAAFVDVADQSRAEGKTDREEVARSRADELRARLPLLIVTFPSPQVDGLELTRDGQPIAKALDGQAVPVDPGPIVITATAPGYERWQTDRRIAERERLTIEVPPLSALGGKAPPAPNDGFPTILAPSTPEEPGTSTQSIVGLVVGGVGLAAIGVGLGVGLAADGVYDDALAGCENSDPTRCDDNAQGLGDDADTLATISTVAVGVGAAAVAAGVVVWLTAPGEDPPTNAVWIVPSGTRSAPFDGARVAYRFTY